MIWVYLNDNLSQVSSAYEQKHSVVGTDNGHVYDGKQKTVFMMLMSHAEWFEPHLSKVFFDFDLLDWLHLRVA